MLLFLRIQWIRKIWLPRYFGFPQSSFPTATYLRSNGSGCPIAALREPHFEVGSPLANSIPSRASYNQNFKTFLHTFKSSLFQKNNGKSNW